jgi:MFS family permease
MLPLGLFRRRNFAFGNVETFAMYGGLSVTFFLLVLYLQEVAGYSALRAGLALLPTTIVTFLLAKRMGRLADRVGPRLFMGLGPLTAAVGLGMMLRLGAQVNYVTDLLPALLVFSVGLASTVAPLTATVLSDADESDAGIASGVNNAIARVAGLLTIATVGAVITAQFNSTLHHRLAGVALSPAARAAVAHARRQTLERADPRLGPVVSHAIQSASVHAFHVSIGISAALVALGGLIGLVAIRNHVLRPEKTMSNRRRARACQSEFGSISQSPARLRRTSPGSSPGRMDPSFSQAERSVASAVRIRS